MATTTNYGWTTPDDTALVKDGASAIRSLGSSIDTSVKSLNPGTTSGDLDYYTSSTAKARLAKGTAGQVLTMNSGATAPEWAALPSSVPANAFADVATSQGTTSTSYTDLTTSGPAVTVTTGTKCLVIVSAGMNQDNQGYKSYMDFAISGATTRSASDSTALIYELPSVSGGGTPRSQVSKVTAVTVTAGSNTFTAKYRSNLSTSTATFQNRQIFVINLA